MAELADAQDLKSCGGDIVPVRFRSPASFKGSETLEKSTFPAFFLLKKVGTIWYVIFLSIQSIYRNKDYRITMKKLVLCYKLQVISFFLLPIELKDSIILISYRFREVYGSDCIAGVQVQIRWYSLVNTRQPITLQRRIRWNRLEEKSQQKLKIINRH